MCTFRFALAFFSILSLQSVELNAQWMQTWTFGGQVNCFAALDTSLFVGTSGGGVWVSTNNGISWSALNSGLANNNVLALLVSETDFFAGTVGGIYHSTDQGASWAAANSGLNTTYVRAFSSSATNLFAGTDYSGGVYNSTDNGASWNPVSSGLNYRTVLSLAVSYDGAGSTNLFAGTFSGGVYRSTNNGMSWTQSGLTLRTVMALVVMGENLFAGTLSGVYRSTNNGTSWDQIDSGLTNTHVHGLAASGTNIFAGTSGGGVFFSTNSGISWGSSHLGLNTYVRAFAIMDSYLIAGTDWNGVWRRPLSEIITDVSGMVSLPMEFSLSQSYPNPFNPTTSVKFALPVQGTVAADVFNALGQKVRTLLHEEKKAGFHELTWDSRGDAGQQLGSGMYFLRLDVRGANGATFSGVRKLLLLK